jgi:hypothetical protein
MSFAASEVLPTRETVRGFYVWMASACALLAFVGFAPTFWLQLGPGTFVGSPLLITHGIVFTAWPLFLLWQTTLVSTGRTALHRAWGMAGVALATAMVCTGFAVANAVLAARLSAGMGDAARAFHIVTMSILLLFAGFVAVAIVAVKRPDIHKRMMLLATFSILPPAIARLSFAVAVGIGPGLRPGNGPPRSVESVMLPALIADALILVCILYDMRTRGRPHPAYLIGGGVILAVQLLRIPLSDTPGWYAIADWLARFGG